MKKKSLIILTVVLIAASFALAGCSGKKDDSAKQAATLANCLTEKGVVMYGSYTCSSCRATRKMFGESFKQINEIECNPTAPETEAELCLQKNIKKTPTWILEKDGTELKRLEGFKTMEDIAAYFECSLT